MRRFGLLTVFSALLSLQFAVPLSALSGLKVAPLEYRSELKDGESKKGFIDISNPTGFKLKIKTSVQGFRQIKDDGSLEFFDDEQLSEGVKTDLDSFALGPRQALRMYFLIDGKKLPSGDVFAVIWFESFAADGKASIGQQVKLGTLLSIVNGTPSQRSAEITQVKTSFLQLSRSVSGSYVIKNIGDPKKSTGFYPSVTIDVWPFGGNTIQQGKLVFAGHQRENQFNVGAPVFGIYKVKVQYQDSAKSRFIFVLHPVALALLIVALTSVVVLLWRRRRYARR